MLYKADNLDFTKVFEIYRNINRSHWKTPTLSDFESSIKEKGYFDFVAGPKENWTSKLVISKNNNFFEVDFIVNEENTSEKIIIDVKNLKEKFLSELNSIFKNGQQG